MRTSNLLATAFELTVDNADAESGICAICGMQDTVTALPIKSSTSDIADTFRGRHICLVCNACFAQPRLFTGSLFADEIGYGCKPVVANPTEERPAWRDLLRELTAGQRVVAVMTSNTKRRLWYRAPVSVIGDAWRLLFVHDSTDRILTIHQGDLLAILDLIEDALNAGFSKRQIYSSLLTAMPRDVRLAIELDTALQYWRAQDEFLVALYAAQKDK